MKGARENQRAAILTLLMAAHGDWVPLPQILALGIAQYNARIYELRRLGFRITNRIEEVDGIRRSWYRLESGVPNDRLQSRPPALATPPRLLLFPNLQPARVWQGPGENR